MKQLASKNPTGDKRARWKPNILGNDMIYHGTTPDLVRWVFPASVVGSFVKSSGTRDISALVIVLYYTKRRAVRHGGAKRVD